mmetsp:Transcript_25778/g.73654  ORF Transcript_25778/g.73654 Transcript_25778/m.73654 type:complete len:279 (+) Transcript_25778:32-868(+)
MSSNKKCLEKAIRTRRRKPAEAVQVLNGLPNGAPRPRRALPSDLPQVVTAAQEAGAFVQDPRAGPRRGELLRGLRIGVVVQPHIAPTFFCDPHHSSGLDFASAPRLLQPDFEARRRDARHELVDSEAAEKRKSDSTKKRCECQRAATGNSPCTDQCACALHGRSTRSRQSAIHHGTTHCIAGKRRGRDACTNRPDAQRLTVPSGAMQSFDSKLGVVPDKPAGSSPRRIQVTSSRQLQGREDKISIRPQSLGDEMQHARALLHGVKDELVVRPYVLCRM